MSIPQETEIRERLANIIKGVDGAESVETRKRLADDATDEDFIALAKDCNPQGIPTLWFLTYVGFTQERVECGRKKILRYRLERLQAYSETSDPPSYEQFVGHIEAVDKALALETNYNLSYPADGNDFYIELGLLQADIDFETRRWGEGEDSERAHYGDLSIEVLFELTTATEG